MDIHLAPGISLIHSHASFRLATGIVLSFLLACTPDGASDLEIVRRDSAGIVIVENILSAPIETGGWAISEGPVLSIGTVEGEDPYQLYGVAGAHRLEDGRIAVVNAGSREVRIFESERQRRRIPEPLWHVLEWTGRLRRSLRHAANRGVAKRDEPRPYVLPIVQPRRIHGNRLR